MVVGAVVSRTATRESPEFLQTRATDWRRPASHATGATHAMLDAMLYAMRLWLTPWHLRSVGSSLRGSTPERPGLQSRNDILVLGFV